jgi:8-oxo-dGTP pyrophosphatase MutT (NUDIX family)
MKKATTKATVVLLVDNKERICLARKKKKIHHSSEAIEYSLGMYNGYGGKMEDSDRTIFDTAIRELFDESGVIASSTDLELAARVYFYVINSSGDSIEPFMDVSFFFLRNWKGVPREGEEMGPAHFFIHDEIPYNEMMPADRILFEEMLSGKRHVYQVNLFGKDITPEVVMLDEVLE